MNEYGFLCLSFILLQLSPEIATVGAQPGPPSATNNNQFSNPNYANFSPSMAIIIVILIAALFLMAFFSIYIRHCSDTSGAGGSIRRALSLRNRRAAAARGLDHSILETFPMFTYSEVKDHKIGKGALECAVCLNEFEESETLRLIPKCDHVFHPECIDAWLESHVTCPVCRANLVALQSDETAQDPELGNANPEILVNENVERTQSSRNETVVVQIDTSNESESRYRELRENVAKRVVMNRNASLEYPNRPAQSWSVPRMFGLGKFRSHSTGHSLVQPGENLDRFTLRLPHEVRKEVMDRAILNRSRSVAATLIREGSSRRGYRTGGGGGWRSYRRLERPEQETKSDRWLFNMTPPFFSRGLSLRSQKVVTESGEGSTPKVGGKTPVKMSSFKCLEPKTADETHLVSDYSALPPV